MLQLLKLKLCVLRNFEGVGAVEIDWHGNGQVVIERLGPVGSQIFSVFLGSCAAGTLFANVQLQCSLTPTRYRKLGPSNVHLDHHLRRLRGRKPAPRDGGGPIHCQTCSPQ